VYINIVSAIMANGIVNGGAARRNAERQIAAMREENAKLLAAIRETRTPATPTNKTLFRSPSTVAQWEAWALAEKRAAERSGLSDDKIDARCDLIDAELAEILKNRGRSDEDVNAMIARTNLHLASVWP
jgi:hypothetical protein